MILVIGGTSDSLILANMLYKKSLDIVLSTATAYGGDVARNAFDGKVIHEAMDYKGLYEYCTWHKVQMIIDASHPYASIISENSIKVSQALGLTYYRYERPMTKITEDIILCKDYVHAASIINKTSGNVLVTTGSRHLESFVAHIHDIGRLYVRVLPKSEHLLMMERIGLKPDQIIGIKGPFTKEMNEAMLMHIKGRYLLTKESGAPGNIDEKIEAARATNAKVVMIQRPTMAYPNVYHHMDELVEVITCTRDSEVK